MQFRAVPGPSVPPEKLKIGGKNCNVGTALEKAMAEPCLVGFLSSLCAQ